MHWCMCRSQCRSNVLTGVKWLPRDFRWHALTSMQNRASQLSMYWGQCNLSYNDFIDGDMQMVWDVSRRFQRTQDRGRVVRKLHTWDSPTLDFAFLYVKMNHFGAHLLVSSKVVGSKVLRTGTQDGHSVWVGLFFRIRNQNGECKMVSFWHES